MAAPKPAGRRKDRKPAGNRKRRWTYYRLHDARDLVVGFKRVAGDVVHYVDLREDHWQLDPIEHVTEVLLNGELPSFAYLAEPKD